TRLGRVRLLRGGARQVERLFLDLAVGDVAHDSDDLGLRRYRCRRRLFERPATHLDPDEINLMMNVAPETEFDAARLAAARRVRKRGEIGRPVGDMDAVEQPVA